MNELIYILDDDAKLNKLLKEYLEKYSYETNSFTSPRDALQNVKRKQPDLMILDLMMPEMDGFEVCKQIRKDYEFPLIMLTARGELTDRVVGLELGADDYMPKPFEPRELVARIAAILRRTGASGTVRSNQAQFGELTLDYASQKATLGEETLDLTGMEYQVLEVFSRNPGRVLSRDRITEDIRGEEFEPFNRSIDIIISRLRQKLKDDPATPHFIKTIRGSGYVFMGES